MSELEDELANVAKDPGWYLNRLHIPSDAGEYAAGLEAILHRIPDGWGRWISCDKGWYKLICDLDRAIAEINPDYEVHQVKEKYGTLRYYCSGDGEPQIRELIREAERLSACTCETCGLPGKLRVRGYWYKTVCDEHAEGYGDIDQGDDDDDD